MTTRISDITLIVYRVLYTRNIFLKKSLISRENTYPMSGSFIMTFDKLFDVSGCCFSLKPKLCYFFAKFHVVTTTSPFPV